MSNVDNPLKWLLAALPGYIEPEHLAVLMERYEANKKAYERQVKIRYAERQIKIRHVERQIKVCERRQDYRDGYRLERWQAKLAKLKEELI